MLSDGIDTARLTLEAALAILKTHGLTIEAARVLHRLGRSDQALAFIETERGIGVSLLRSTLLFAQGEAAENADELDGAREAYEGALEEGRAAAAASTGAVRRLRALARVARRQGDMGRGHPPPLGGRRSRGARAASYRRGDAPQTSHVRWPAGRLPTSSMDGLFERGTLNDSAAALWVIELPQRARGLADELDPPPPESPRRGEYRKRAGSPCAQLANPTYGPGDRNAKSSSYTCKRSATRCRSRALRSCRMRSPRNPGERTLLLSYYVAPGPVLRLGGAREHDLGRNDRNSPPPGSSNW